MAFFVGLGRGYSESEQLSPRAIDVLLQIERDES